MLSEIVQRLVQRDEPRSEADVQADVRSFILEAPFSLEEQDVKIVSLETLVGDKRRIDVEVGSTVIEVKRNLRKGNIRAKAVEQLAGYVETRANQTGLRYVGVLTDGVEWRCYQLDGSELVEVAAFDLAGSSKRIDDLTVWLEGVLATSQGIPPTPAEIKQRLGARSSSHQLDRATLAALYAKHKKSPSIILKRTLWSRLLMSALGTQFNDSDELFVEHTLLVNIAEIIAHALLGLSVTEVDPESLVTGAKFDESGVYGVVEADFFDWVVEIPEGQRFVSTMARRLDRFVWSSVDHDVLKVLYESVIGTETRKRLGEYYTPDWMAECIVKKVVHSPLDQRELDPACGSGTFLFHAVRNFLEYAEASGLSISECLRKLTNSVIGMDLHPVAVAFARVTYLLAIGRDRLVNPEREVIQIPVYLGDSIQWRQQVDLMTAGSLVVHTDDSKELFSSELRFPDELLANAADFDKLVLEMSSKASTRKIGAPVPSLKPVFSRLGISTKFHPEIEATFKTMCRLHDEGRDHIWAYYIRNLARPMWLMNPENRVDVIVGNPPWLAFRKMTAEMQTVFKTMSDARGLWHGAEVATQQDLSGLFMTRALQLYLKVGGSFGLVLPNAAIDRTHFKGLRDGHFEGTSDTLSIEYQSPWDFRRVRPHIFPRGSCVLFGTRSEIPVKLPKTTVFWSGKIDDSIRSWEDAYSALTKEEVQLSDKADEKSSPYRERFRNGATVFPRVLFIVEKTDAGPLGTPSGKAKVQSVRSSNEKKPWKELPNLTGVVETEFIRPIIMSECLVPFRTLNPVDAVLPIRANEYLGDNAEKLSSHSGLFKWWTHAEELWNTHSAGSSMGLSAQLNYMRKLVNQLPPSSLRVVYNKSGMHVVASKVRDKRAIIENGLYWTAVSSEKEADYLCAILNASVITNLVRPLMSYGKDERDVAKSIWRLPIPEFDSSDELHLKIAHLGNRLGELASEFDAGETKHNPTMRRRYRGFLEPTAEMNALNDLIRNLITFEPD